VVPHIARRTNVSRDSKQGSEGANVRLLLNMLKKGAGNRLSCELLRRVYGKEAYVLVYSDRCLENIVRICVTYRCEFIFRGNKKGPNYPSFPCSNTHDILTSRNGNPRD
jgi:hypothetical protein